jgi:DNA-binding transcriptional MerR regulator
MNWYVKEFSKLTGVSVATLHHYDAIELLKPSMRLSNDYRQYSENDLLKLERIIALKFFGFNLQKIKVLVGPDEEVLDHLKSQVSFLDGQIKQLHQARALVNTIVAGMNAKKTVDWSLTVSLIKVYQMTKESHAAWASKVYTEKELAEFTAIDNKYSEEQKTTFRKLWAELFLEAGKHLDKSPESAIGRKLGLQYIALKAELKEAYKDYPELWKKICTVHQSGQVPDEISLSTKEQQAWITAAANAVAADKNDQ